MLDAEIAVQFIGRSQHKLIPPFSLKTLPDFTVLTGINGSGKTQFLEAIMEGIVRCDHVEPFPEDLISFGKNPFSNGGKIVMLSYQKVSSDSFRTTVHTSVGQRFGAGAGVSPGVPDYDFTTAKLRTLSLHSDHLKSALGEDYLRLEKVNRDIWSLGAAAVIDYCGIRSNLELKDKVTSIFRRADEKLLASDSLIEPDHHQMQAAIRTVCLEEKISPTAVTAPMANGVRNRKRDAMFFPDVADVMSRYRDALRA